MRAVLPFIENFCLLLLLCFLKYEYVSISTDYVSVFYPTHYRTNHKKADVPRDSFAFRAWFRM